MNTVNTRNTTWYWKIGSRPTRRRLVGGCMSSRKPQDGRVGDTVEREMSLSLVEAFVQSPLVFLLGACTGIMSLDVQQDPLKSWIHDRAREYQDVY